MSKPNFFADSDALNALLQMELAETVKDIDLTIDVTDFPYWFSFHSDENTQTLKAYQQMDMYMKDEGMFTELGILEHERATGKVTGRAPKEIGDNIQAFFAACLKLGALIQAKGLEPLYEGLDPEQAGILLTAEDGELSWKVVSGAERPALTVHTMFGEITVCRPYLEDFFERSALESMSPEELQEAAENGDISAMKEMFSLYLNGDESQGIETDPEKCIFWIRKAAETGDSEALFDLGLFCAKGFGTERDFAKAAEWMEKAAEAGDTDAPVVMLKYRLYAEAAEKAKSGDAQAQADYAEALMEMGSSLDQAGPGNDYAESVQWAEKAAGQGNGKGLYILGLAYSKGRGVAQDEQRAAEYYRRGAELSHPGCQHNLGCLYMNGGSAVEKDTKKGFALIMAAAEQGYGLAMKDLGRCYQFGDGCTGNMQTALEWYTKASEVLHDPELDARVMTFRQMAESDPTWGEDYPGNDEEEDDGLPEGVFDATEEMRRNLEAAGMDASDEAIANMSVEEAYAALFGDLDDEDE